ncbi:MAG TPA: archaeal heat shock protein Hsp20 [Nitrososphaeraceae archaeon]|nr:archaeal heat shock protein Hsp20 [Nitrososphaeraceae archaeon]
MSFWGIEPEDWFRRFFGSSSRMPSPSSSSIGRGGWFGDMPRQFDEMRREMQRMFEEQFKDIQSNIPKELVREYETPQGGKVREIGPLVYGYSMTIGPDGKPKVREFGNVRSPFRLGATGTTSGIEPFITGEREALADVVTSDKEVKVVVEIPGVNKESIKINAYDNSLEVITNDPQKKYHQVIDLPPDADIETVKSTYRNGILEIVFKKKEQAKPKGKEIKVE